MCVCSQGWVDTTQRSMLAPFLYLFCTIVFDTVSLSKPGAHHFGKVPSWQVLGSSCTWFVPYRFEPGYRDARKPNSGPHPCVANTFQPRHLPGGSQALPISSHVQCLRKAPGHTFTHKSHTGTHSILFPCVWVNVCLSCYYNLYHLPIN